MNKTKEYRLKEAARISFFGLWLAFSLFIVLGFITVRPNLLQKEVSDKRTQIFADKKEVKEDGTWEYSIDVREYAKDSQYILFYSNHQVVYVYANNRICYSLQPQNSIWGHSTGSAWNMFKLPANTSVLRVEVKRVYPEMGNVELNFFVGESSVMTRSVIMDSLAGLITSLTILIFGIIMLIYWFSLGDNKDSALATFYFAFFTILMGIWSIGETQAAMIVVRNRPMASYLGYMCIYFLCVPFVMFVRYFLHSKEDIIYKIYFVTWAVVLLLVNILQFFNIRDLKQMAFLIHAMLAVGLLYCIYLLVHAFLTKQRKRESWLCAVGFICVALTYVVDVAWFYVMSTHTNQIGKFGFLLFIIILGGETLHKSETVVRQARQMDFYLEMAVKDMLSGCYNRNAYDQDVEEWDKKEEEKKLNTAIYTFDLNNLKNCNDTLGHSVGDKYIVDAARLIHNIFGENEKVYRIGGDEFCVIQKFISYEKSEQLCKMINNNQFIYGDEQPVECSVAAGYARYMRGDVSINDTRTRADAMMYANKKKMKDK